MLLKKPRHYCAMTLVDWNESVSEKRLKISRSACSICALTIPLSSETLNAFCVQLGSRSVLLVDIDVFWDY